MSTARSKHSAIHIPMFIATSKFVRFLYFTTFTLLTAISQASSTLKSRVYLPKTGHCCHFLVQAKYFKNIISTLIRISSNTPQRAPFFPLGSTGTDGQDNPSGSPSSSSSDSSSDDTGYLADDELSDWSTSVGDRFCDTDNPWWCLITECLKGQRDG
jgi:hypothetical protein